MSTRILKPNREGRRRGRVVDVVERIEIMSSTLLTLWRTPLSVSVVSVYKECNYNVRGPLCVNQNSAALCDETQGVIWPVSRVMAVH